MKGIDCKGKNLLEALEGLEINLFTGDLLTTWDRGKDDILAILTLAELLKELYSENVLLRLFQTGMAVSFFRDKSTRTRLAFSSACDLLGLTNQEIDEKKLQLSHGETVRETAQMISFLTEVIGVRDDTYLGRGHRFMEEIIDGLKDGFREKVLKHRPAVINLQSDYDHPTQTLSDLLHLKEHVGTLEDLRGKKLVMSWAYSPTYGKPLSVPQGIIALMSRFGMDVVLAYPEGYDLVPDTIEKASLFSDASGGSFSISHDMKEAFRGADAVYPKSWAPYHVMKRRTELLECNDHEGQEKLEEECLRQNSAHKDWICDESLMARTRGGEALYLHCLPADIKGLNCRDGEVSRRVFEHSRYDTYREARNKAFVIASIIILCRFHEPAAIMKRLCQSRHSRVS